ncbi:Aldo/keto reductase [Phlegmacium glaucopus]|nr:Aldo/keto reductase [Phlegmacium glaucopus]
MPWNLVKLNDGNWIPSIGFGTWNIPIDNTTTDRVDQAISVGFNHIDTAEYYGNEAQVALAIRESGLPRNDIFITTKYSAEKGLDTIEAAFRDSLKNLGVEYVDLYLIHDPRLTPDIPAAWKKLEDIKKAGLAKSIGISNFHVNELQILLASAKIKPAVNQILFHPYVYAYQAPILEFGAAHNIVTEAYSVLTPITSRRGPGPLDKPLKKIRERLGATDDQVLLAWAKAKGTIVLTSSSKKSRLEGYLAAGDFVLTDDEIKSIDEAGARGARQIAAKAFLRKIALLMFPAAIGFGVCSFFQLNIF